MSVVLHIHRRNGRVVTLDSAKPPRRKKTHDCACQSRDQTPGADRLRQALEIWKQSLAMTQAEIDAAIPADRPPLQRILQNQTIRISQIEAELFRLAGG